MSLDLIEKAGKRQKQPPKEWRLDMQNSLLIVWLKVGVKYQPGGLSGAQGSTFILKPYNGQDKKQVPIKSKL